MGILDFSVKNNALWLLLFFISFSYLRKKYSMSKNEKELYSKIVVITGASSGLGEALAYIFYHAGCKLILIARRENELQRVCKELNDINLKKGGFQPVPFVLDVEDWNSIEEAGKKILKIYGGIDILINNAGISVRSDVISTSMEVYTKVMSVNFLGGVALTKALLPAMISKGSGRIVFISSVQGKFALPFRSAYSASKHAIQAFADSLRTEVDQYNIKVSVISPGYIKTNLSLNALKGDGAPHGKMDPSTASGDDPKIMAKQIFKSILEDRKDIVLANTSSKVAFWLRILFPSLYFPIISYWGKRKNLK